MDNNGDCSDCTVISPNCALCLNAIICSQCTVGWSGVSCSECDVGYANATCSDCIEGYEKSGLRCIVKGATAAAEASSDS